MAQMHVFNTKGAAKRLGCSETWMHRLVATGKLKAYIYDDNRRLVERKPEEKRQGQMHVFAPLLANPQPGEVREPGQDAFDHTAVTAQPLM